MGQLMLTDRVLLGLLASVDRPVRCGIHGTVIVERRCADCDEARRG